MSEPDSEIGTLLVTRILIERRLTTRGDEVRVSVLDAEGGTPPFIETLGLMSMANDSIIRQYMDEQGGEDDA